MPDTALHLAAMRPPSGRQWSRRWSMIFIAGTSLACWCGIVVAGVAMISQLGGI